MGSPLIWFGAAAKLLKSQLTIPGSTSGLITIQPAAITTTHTLTMPSANVSGYLNNNGSGTLSWTSGTAGVAPTVQKFLSTGTTTGYMFTVTAANATVGATYTNNGQTFTVINTIAAGTILFCSQPSTPTASGTLTKSGGTGDASITFSAAQAYATYTTAASTLYLRVRVLGGGGGGAGSGTSPAAAPSGNTSVFGANLINCGGATGANPTGVNNSSNGSGGSASLGAAVGIAYVGSRGQGGQDASNSSGMQGGNSALGGAGSGAPGNSASNGNDAVVNSGAGGGGGAGTASARGGAGGGAGGYVDAIITSPAASYPYIVGTGGAGGTAGTSGFAGGAGGAGIVIVEEMYQ